MIHLTAMPNWGAGARSVFRTTAAFLAMLSSGIGTLFAQTPSPARDEPFLREARQLRESSLSRLPWTALTPADGLVIAPPDKRRQAWKTQVETTLFWIGRGPSDKAEGNQGKTRSAWDSDWVHSYGGYDNPDPEQRGNFAPAEFEPKLNPFYVALPYNDLDASGHTKPEAKLVIPWFQQAALDDGKSVCRDRWVAIRDSATGKICYAQWSDCGPQLTDHWQYVFGNENPKPVAGSRIGLAISPAVRAFLGLAARDITDWRFVSMEDVPKGPWRLYGKNNPFAPQGHRE